MESKELLEILEDYKNIILEGEDINQITSPNLEIILYLEKLKKYSQEIEKAISLFSDSENKKFDSTLAIPEIKLEKLEDNGEEIDYVDYENEFNQAEIKRQTAEVEDTNFDPDIDEE